MAEPRGYWQHHPLCDQTSPCIPLTRGPSSTCHHDWPWNWDCPLPVFLATQVVYQEPGPQDAAQSAQPDELQEGTYVRIEQRDGMSRD